MLLLKFLKRNLKLDKEELQRRREYWCRAFGLPLSFLEGIEDCVKLGERNLTCNDNVKSKKESFFFGKKKKKKKKRR